jgi:hypothetical protein
MMDAKIIGTDGVTKYKSAQNWYKEKIGEIFDIGGYSKNFYEVNSGPEKGKLIAVEDVILGQQHEVTKEFRSNQDKPEF